MYVAYCVKAAGRFVHVRKTDFRVNFLKQGRRVCQKVENVWRKRLIWDVPHVVLRGLVPLVVFLG